MLAVELLLSGNEPLAAAMAKVRQLTEQVRVLEERVRGLTGEKAEAVRLAKHWRKKVELLERGVVT